MAKKISPKTLWSAVIKSAAEKRAFQETSVDNWLKPLNPIKYADGILLLETENNFAPQVLNARYRQKLCEIAKAIDEDFVSMTFAVAGEIKDAASEKNAAQIPQNPDNTAPGQGKKAPFVHPVNRQYTFDNFVNTYENQLTVSSALGIANAPGKMRQYNPFYIYGKAGVGKTHILHAIANEITKNDPNSRVTLVGGNPFYWN
jgi:chromosomal replication initiator protein